MKYDEDIYLKQVEFYIRETYQKHYVDDDGGQLFDTILSAGHGEGFCVGNAMKYLFRYGKKNGAQRTDILKAIHYLILLLYVDTLKKYISDEGSEYTHLLEKEVD